MVFKYCYQVSKRCSSSAHIPLLLSQVLWTTHILSVSSADMTIICHWPLSYQLNAIPSFCYPLVHPLINHCQYTAVNIFFFSSMHTMGWIFKSHLHPSLQNSGVESCDSLIKACQLCKALNSQFPLKLMMVEKHRAHPTLTESGPESSAGAISSPQNRQLRI